MFVPIVIAYAHITVNCLLCNIKKELYFTPSYGDSWKNDYIPMKKPLKFPPLKHVHAFPS